MTAVRRNLNKVVVQLPAGNSQALYSPVSVSQIDIEWRSGRELDHIPFKLLLRYGGARDPCSYDCVFPSGGGTSDQSFITYPLDRYLMSIVG